MRDIPGGGISAIPDILTELVDYSASGPYR